MAQQYMGTVPLYPRSHYVAELRAEIPESAYEPARSRLLLIPLYAAITALGIASIGLGWLPWYVWPLVSIVIGASFACQTFITHEILHGGITRNKTLAYAQALLGFLPFLLAPRTWIAWHNQTHHAITNQPGDPDAFPTLEEYLANGNARFAVKYFAVGPHRLRGLWTMSFGFMMQAAHQTHSSKKYGYKVNPILGYGESLLMVAVWVALLWAIGFVPWLFAFLLPHMIANAIVIAFILTNHSLSPFIPINDPLITGLSVTVPKWVDRLTLNFGYHTEHHLFPAMSSRHAELIRKLCIEHWPERYQSMPLVQAMLEINRTARVYKDAVTLYDPDSGRTFPAILPRERTNENQAAA
ncbi:MAG: fatty acid desaturase [Kofleriaceae bacterium]